MSWLTPPGDSGDDDEQGACMMYEGASSSTFNLLDITLSILRASSAVNCFGAGKLPLAATLPPLAARLKGDLLTARLRLGVTGCRVGAGGFVVP
eukprot:CAMPEP_0173093370 /NCGR_PEP_ID=MMETSP1102-20130122/30010_1 /TAXON_ID=49646 /ORGANISM="Geminigera sp., Strain Caron Lab Isolate" /LENGTH=93 /DNA_ID=CAMNT_0013981493 /DNA_START=1176 /DNA_END=1455 /DNA_ORIENTATION=-